MMKEGICRLKAGLLLSMVFMGITTARIEMDKIPAISKTIELKSAEGLVNASISQKFVEKKLKPKEEKEQGLNMLLSSVDSTSDQGSFFSLPESKELRKLKEQEAEKKEKEDEMLKTYGQPIPDRKAILGEKKVKANELDQYLPKIESLDRIFKKRRKWPKLGAKTNTNSNSNRKLFFSTKKYKFPGLPYDPETDKVTLPPLPPLGAQDFAVKGFKFKNKASLALWLAWIAHKKQQRIKAISDEFYNKFVETRSAAQRDYEDKIETAIRDFHDKSSHKIKSELEKHEQVLKQNTRALDNSIRAGVKLIVKKLTNDNEKQYKAIRMRQVLQIKKSAKRMFKKMYKEYLLSLDMKHEYYNTEPIHIKDAYNEREFHVGNYDDGDH